MELSSSEIGIVQTLYVNLVMECLVQSRRDFLEGNGIESL